MSIQTEITRLQGLRNTLRAALVALGLAQSAADLGADGAEAAGTMPNNGAVQASIDGLTQTEYTVPAGYHTGTGKVSLTGDIEEALAAI